MAGSSPAIWRMGIIAESAAITRETLPTLTSEAQLTSNARFDPKDGDDQSQEEGDSQSKEEAENDT